MSASEIIRRGIEIGKQNGNITFDELNKLCGSRVAPEDIERIFQALGEAGIRFEEE